MRVEKISEDDIVLALEPPPRSGDELRQQACQALQTLGIAQPESLTLEAYTAGHETLVFVHRSAQNCWRFPSLEAALDAAAELHTPTLTLLRSTAGEWFLEGIQSHRLWEFGELCAAPLCISHHLFLEPERLQGSEGKNCDA